MIVTAPTGLYEPILPQSSEDAGNFTYTISSQSPPRSAGTFVQLPAPEVFRKQPDRVYTKQQKRVFLGKLVFDVTVPGPAITGSGTAQFDIGDILEFVDADPVTSDPFTLVREQVRQDLKAIDFESAGLSKDEYIQLREASERRMDEITVQIAEVSSDINSNKESIQHNQANINNSRSLLDNIILVLGDDSVQAEKVKNNLDDLNARKADLLVERQQLQASLQTLRDELQKVREVVR